jgi:phosphoenolpyruvate carboxykinase (ATP)
MPIGYTRALLSAALSGELDHAKYRQDPVFNLDVPNECPGVPAEVLMPRRTWADPLAYDSQAAKLAKMFAENFKNFEGGVSAEVLAAGPNA